MTDIRRFALRTDDGKEIGIFTGKSPRQAALKVANAYGGSKEMPATVKLREFTKRKMHVFEVWKDVVDAPANKPAWLPAKINKAFVKKIKIEKMTTPVKIKE
jgi:hypothetical protein